MYRFTESYSQISATNIIKKRNFQLYTKHPKDRKEASVYDHYNLHKSDNTEKPQGTYMSMDV